jgi:hypothetical protein
MHEKMTKIINQILEVDNDIDDSSDSGDPVATDYKYEDIRAKIKQSKYFSSI